MIFNHLRNSRCPLSISFFFLNLVPFLFHRSRKSVFHFKIFQVSITLSLKIQSEQNVCDPTTISVTDKVKWGFSEMLERCIALNEVWTEIYGTGVFIVLVYSCWALKALKHYKPHLPIQTSFISITLNTYLSHSHHQWMHQGQFGA